MNSGSRCTNSNPGRSLNSSCLIFVQVSYTKQSEKKTEICVELHKKSIIAHDLMSSEKKDYSAVGAPAPSAPAYITVPNAAAAHQVTMATPYPAYPPPAYSSQAYLPSSAPTYLPASYAAAPLQHHLPYGTVSVPNITAFGVPPQYLPQLAQVYSARPGAVYVPAAAAYDAGARFDGHAMSVVPPPPPGVAPNAAQLAMMQGNPVVLSQQKNSFLTGGTGAGYTFW